MTDIHMTFLTVAQARSVDRIAVDRYHIPSILLMENAGRGVADVMGRLGIDGQTVICCGKGNNGGDGLVLARQLDMLGYAVEIWSFCEPDAWKGDAAIQARICHALNIPTHRFDSSATTAFEASLHSADWVVDGLLGTGATGRPRPPYDQAIELMNRSAARRMALDIPSGLDADSGEVANPTFVANHTCTFVAAKPGLVSAGAKPFVGQLHVVPIGIPSRVVDDAVRD